jgi:hypothetical protein
LRDELDLLSDTYGAFTAGLESLDAAAPIDAAISSAGRRASTAIRRWQARPAPVQMPAARNVTQHRLRLWAVPAAAAAIVLVGIGIALYCGSASTRRLAKGPTFPSTGPGTSEMVGEIPGITSLPPLVRVNPPAEDEAVLEANLIAMTTPNVEIDRFAGIAEADPDPGSARDEGDSKSSHEDNAIFDIPLPKDPGQ